MYLSLVNGITHMNQRCNSGALSALARTLFLGAAVGAAAAPAFAASAAWQPDKTVELVIGAGAGGSQDQTVRTLHKIIQDKHLVPVTSTVVNKPGAGGSIALSYIAQNAGDPRLLLMVSPTMSTNHIVGKSTLKHQDLTTLATLFNEYIGFTVRVESPIKDGRDFAQRLRSNPSSLSIAVGTSLGNANHIAVGQVLRAMGAGPDDLKKLKLLAFKSGGEALTALLGGHIDALVLTPTNLVPHVQSGKLRMIAITAPKRLGGAMASVPTWKEQGVNVQLESWRAMVAPPGLPAAPVAYWEDVLAKLMQTPEWQAELQKNFWEGDFRRSASARKYLDAEYEELKAALTALGLVK